MKMEIELTTELVEELEYLKKTYGKKDYQDVVDFLINKMYESEKNLDLDEEEEFVPLSLRPIISVNDDDFNDSGIATKVYNGCHYQMNKDSFKRLDDGRLVCAMDEVIFILVEENKGA